ncbi:MAG: VWA domain-containing protein, partial [Candidatus Aminicenantes bacterium]|nr:VWA domain-containing protein [Candidatus Aminicenantes bacterium]
MRLFPDIHKKRNDSIKTTFFKSLAYCAVLLILMGFSYTPSLPGESSSQAGTTAQGQTQPPAKTQAQPAVQPPPPPPPPKLSILLLIDTSGSMNSNNKIENAKAAAIRAVKGALTPQAVASAQGTQPITQPPVAPIVAGSGIPQIPVKIAQEFNKNLQALKELQNVLGKDIRSWLSKSRAGDMGEILKNCNKLMEGLAFDQKSFLMKELNPLIEKMHYSIAARVNAELKAQGITKGLKYVIPGKTPTHPEFGGMFTLKASDHDAIYFGEGADDAVRLHKELAKNYGDDFLHFTESCLESSKYTIEHFEKGLRKQAFERFSGATSNLDWMRSPSGSKWVQEYVDNAGTVVDLDDLDDVAKVKPAGESGSALRSLSGYTDNELKAIGMVMDRSRLSGMGYNLGLQSDFERQLMLNRTRKGLERGLATATAEDTAMLMAKYGPRYEEVLQSANANLQGTPWQGYVEKLKAAGKKAKGGATLDAAEKGVIAEFDEFAGFVRQQSMAKQMDKFGQLKDAFKAANQAGADEATIAGLRSQMTDLVDDTQAALHNYQQIYGKDFADDIVKQISTTHDDFAKGLTRRLQNS